MPKWAIRVGQGVLLLAVVGFVARAVIRYWDELGAADVPSISVQPVLILATAITVWATYLLLILAWRFVLSGWGERLELAAAVRIWCLSNLGRYVPGKVWAVAGMAALAKAAGINGWAATASALVMQVIALTTAGVVILATATTLTASGDLNLPLILSAATVGVIGTWSLTLAPVMRLLERLTGGRFRPQPLRPVAVAAAAGSTLLSWLVYGVALWLLARATIPTATLGIVPAVGSFAAAYVLGLITVFAPGGLGVREGVLFVLLTPIIGAGNALVLVPASRLLLTGTEVIAAGASWMLLTDDEPKEIPSV